MIETNRLKIYPATRLQMEKFISEQEISELKTAYSEMLEGCLTHPNLWKWYAIWMIELKNGTHVGELCFKGISNEGLTEIGYGILEKYQKQGYATEAISAVVDWALNQPNITGVTAEIDKENTASIKVAKKAMFIETGNEGKEGLIFIRKLN